MEKYTQFLESQLKADYYVLLQNSEQLEKKLSDYEDLETWIGSMKTITSKTVKTLINIGEDLFMKAKIDNQNKICVDVGLGFFLECSYEEALKIITQRKPIIAKKISENEHKMAQILANILIFEKTIEKVSFGLPIQENL